MYMGYDENAGNFYVASEMKALTPVCKSVQEFPPGHYLWSKDGELTRYYERDWMDYDNIKDNVTDKPSAARCPGRCRQASTGCATCPTASCYPVVSTPPSSRRSPSNMLRVAWKMMASLKPGGHTALSVCCGPEWLTGSRAAAQSGGSPRFHHLRSPFTVQEGLDALRDVIYHLETYDVTTIRLYPMYLMARYIKAMGIKMVLSGEGSDELFGGYLYFHKAPDAKGIPRGNGSQTLATAYVRLSAGEQIHGCLGWEGQPFLDKEFTDAAMRVNPKRQDIVRQWRLKSILPREIEHYLPKEVAWRQKEQFSDGVGYSWIDSLKVHVENEVSDQMFEAASFV